jgi:hypothetical protein
MYNFLKASVVWFGRGTGQAGGAVMIVVLCCCCCSVVVLCSPPPPLRSNQPKEKKGRKPRLKWLERENHSNLLQTTLTVGFVDEQSKAGHESEGQKGRVNQGGKGKKARLSSQSVLVMV